MQPESVIEIHLHGETTGKLWTGNFKCLRYLTHRQKLTRDRLVREYLGGDAPQHSTEIGRAYALATFKVALTEVPEWFRDSSYGMDLADEKLIGDLYEKIEEVQKAHREEHAKVLAQAKDEVKQELKSK